MNNLFHVIEDAQVVLRSKGTFYQKKVYRRGDRLFAGWGAGFIRIGAGDATSNPHVSWETLDLPAGLNLGRGQIGEPIILPTVPQGPHTLKAAA